MGRTYAIPFSRVWDAALDLVRGELPRWHARWWDEETGVIQALSRRRLSRRASDVVIRIRLDAEGQTRVDLRSASRSKRLGDFGSNTRLIGAFTTALDRKLTTPQAPPVPAPESAGDIPEDAGERAQAARDSAPVDDAPPGVGAEAPGAREDRDQSRADRPRRRARTRPPHPRGLRSRNRRHRGRRGRRGRRAQSRRLSYRWKLLARTDRSEPDQDAVSEADPPGADESPTASRRPRGGRGRRFRGPHRGGRRRRRLRRRRGPVPTAGGTRRPNT